MNLHFENIGNVDACPNSDNSPVPYIKIIFNNNIVGTGVLHTCKITRKKHPYLQYSNIPSISKTYINGSFSIKHIYRKLIDHTTQIGGGYCEEQSFNLNIVYSHGIYYISDVNVNGHKRLSDMKLDKIYEFTAKNADIVTN